MQTLYGNVLHTVTYDQVLEAQVIYPSPQLKENKYMWMSIIEFMIHITLITFPYC